MALVEPRYSVIVAGQDVTDLIDMDSLHRSMSERGEASATIDLPVASENDIPVNGLVRDAAVEIAMDGGVEWVGHVVCAHKPRSSDLRWTLDCAGEWDNHHHRDDWCKGFVETRCELFQTFGYGMDYIVSRQDAVTIDTDGQVLLCLPAGEALTLPYQGQAVYLHVLDGMDDNASISRVTCNMNASGSSLMSYELRVLGSPFVPVPSSAAAAGTCSGVVSAVDFTPGAGTWTTLVFRMWSGGAITPIGSDIFAQISDLRIYVDRTTAPRIDEIVAAIDAEVRPTSPAPSTEAIGSPLASFMCDPFMMPSEGIAQALTKAAAPPLCGVFGGQLIVKNRPASPPDASRLWIVSEQLTPGLVWGVEVDEEQSKDYVTVSYALIGANLVTVPNPVDSSTWPAAWYRSNVTNCTPAAGTGAAYFRIRSNATAYNPMIYFAPIAVVASRKVRLRASLYLGSYVNGTARVYVNWYDAVGTYISGTVVYSKAAADATEHWIDSVLVPPAGAASAWVLADWTGRATSGDTSLYLRYVDFRPTIPDGTPQVAYYPSAPPAASSRAGLIDGGELTAAEAALAAQQAYSYLHGLASGPVTVPYVVMDANGGERPADVIRAWDWIQNVGLLDERAGPFLVSEVEHQGGVASLTIGSQESYAYNGPTRMPTKGRYVGAHRVRTKYKKRVSFAAYWKWRYRSAKRTPKMPARHSKFGTIYGYRWTDVEGTYL